MRTQGDLEGEKMPGEMQSREFYSTSPARARARMRRIRLRSPGGGDDEIEPGETLSSIRADRTRSYAWSKYRNYPGSDPGTEAYLSVGYDNGVTKGWRGRSRSRLEYPSRPGYDKAPHDRKVPPDLEELEEFVSGETKAYSPAGDEELP